MRHVFEANLRMQFGGSQIGRSFDADNGEVLLFLHQWMRGDQTFYEFAECCSVE